MTELTDRLRHGPPIAAVTPPTFATSDVSYAVHDTVLGRLLLARRSDSGPLLACLYLSGPDTGGDIGPGTGTDVGSGAGAGAGALNDEPTALARIARVTGPRVLRRPAALDPVRRWLDGYLDGGRQELDVPYELSLATAYQRVVLETLRAQVGYGARASYRQLATWTGRPQAARAVGTALAANPLCVVLPCHRIVASSGALTGYAGGLAAKERLLALEAARAG